jgi:hypothetical protein
MSGLESRVRRLRRVFRDSIDARFRSSSSISFSSSYFDSGEKRGYHFRYKLPKGVGITSSSDFVSDSHGKVKFVTDFVLSVPEPELRQRIEEMRVSNKKLDESSIKNRK